MRKLLLEKEMSGEQRRLAVEAAMLLGFQSESATFPVIGADGEIRVPETAAGLSRLWSWTAEAAPEGYQCAPQTGPLFDIDFREKKGMECMFGDGPFLADTDYDFLPDQVNVKIVLPEEADDAVLTAACNLAFRLGMETVAYEGGILAGEGYEGNAIVFADAEQPEAALSEQDGTVRLVISGRGQELVDFTAKLCQQFPKSGEWKTWRDLLLEMTDDLVLRGADGQLAYLDARKKAQPGGYSVYASPELKEEQKAHFPDVEFFNYKSGRKIYERVYELPWEVETFTQVLEEEVYPRLKAGDRLRLGGALSEDQQVRTELVQDIEKAAEGRGAVLEGAELVCAYKQGFSWLEEIVIPAAKEMGPDKVEIYFKPYLPEGQTEWLDENGATPNGPNVKAEDPEKWYDLPIRYLQELYPIEDVLVRELGVDREQVVFLPYEGEEDLTYLCRVSKGTEVCFEKTYLARAAERPYLDAFPQLGKVHPATGYVQAWINGEEVLNRTLRTDLEEIWDVYQAKVLPELTAYIEEKIGTDVRPEHQPFFNELRLDVTVSEPERRLGSREDLFSPLDALHEDLYFTGTDYFKNYGMQKAGVMLDAPGLLLPVLHAKKGRPVFRVTVSDQLKERACICRGGEEILGGTSGCGPTERSQVTLYVKKVSCAGGKLAVTVRAKGAEEAVLQSYAELLEQGVLQMAGELEGYGSLRFETDGGSEIEARIPETQKPAKTKKITDIDLHEQELIGYDTCRGIIEELKQVPGIEVFRTATSYTGRELFAIWIMPRYEGYLSLTKRLSRLPSEIINARHHANEVSSTNASFILLKQLLTDEKFRDLPEKLNLVLVPMENVDGAAIHYELQKEHPYWKFHVARFNSLGKEFYYEHFQPDTIHSEAMGLTRLYERFIPDVLVDNHGVPSHEWEQQFSGYTSPSYKGFWLPRSLLYGYYWYVTNPEYAANYPVNRRMEDVIADRIAEDAEMTRWNKEWSAQFEKYAHAWMPKLFPAEYYKDMIDYWIPFASDPTHRYPSIRFPWITTVAYTSEVADETAQGSYLNLCARAHAAHDEATIEMLMQARCVCESAMGCEDTIFARYARRRPLIV